MARRHIFLLSLLLLSGCVSQKIKTPLTDRKILMHEASATHQLHTDILALEVPSHGWLADAGFRTMSRLRGSSKVAKQIAESILLLREQEATVMLFGPNSHKTARVTIDALTLLKTRGSRQLTLIYAGTESDFQYVQKKVPFFPGRLLYINQPER